MTHTLVPVTRRRLPALFAVMLALAASPGSAHEQVVGGMRIKHPYAVEPQDATRDVPVFMTIVTGAQADRLVGARSPFAKKPASQGVAG